MISILIPSRDRPQNIQRLSDSVRKTTQGLPAEIVVYIDNDEPQLAAYNKLAKNGAIDKLIIGPRLVFSDNWNACSRAALGDIQMLGGDDIIFKTYGWDRMVEDAFAKSDDKILLVYGDDCHFGPRFGSHPIIHKRWIDAIGRFVPEYFSSDMADNWLWALAEWLDRKQFLPFITEHLHPAWDKVAMDRTYQENNDRRNRDKPHLLFQTLSKERFQDLEKLRKVTIPPNLSLPAPNFTVIIPSKIPTNLLSCVKAIYDNEPWFTRDNIIVVDDGARTVETENLAVRWIPGIKPFVYAKNVNLGIKAADSDVIILNDDARLATPGGFTELAQHGREHPKFGVLAASVTKGRQAEQRQWQFLLRDVAIMVGFVGVFVSKTTQQNVGVFDERFTGYGFEDWDYCRRVLTLGLKVGIDDAVSLDHSIQGTYQKEPDLGRIENNNKELYKAKWGLSSDDVKDLISIVSHGKVRQKPTSMSKSVSSVIRDGKVVYLNEKGIPVE